MARRSDHSREEQKQMAIAAGQKIISEDGFSGFSARKVAREIGYTIGTIYNIFDSHDDLILHINAMTLADLQRFIEQGSIAESDGTAQLKQLANRYLEFASTNQARWSALFEHNLAADIELPSWYVEKINALFVVIEAGLAPLIVDKKQREQTAKALWASIHGICALALSGKLDVVGAKSVQVLMDDLIDNYLRGIALLNHERGSD